MWKTPTKGHIKSNLFCYNFGKVEPVTPQPLNTALSLRLQNG